MSIAFVNGEILTPDGFVTDRALLVEGTRIEDVVASDDPRVTRATRVEPAVVCYSPDSSIRRSTAAAGSCSMTPRQLPGPRHWRGAQPIRDDGLPAHADQR